METPGSPRGTASSAAASHCCSVPPPPPPLPAVATAPMARATAATCRMPRQQGLVHLQHLAS
jgi:hypothetical protein